MIAIINFLVLLAATILTLVFYWISVSPAALERVWGGASYSRCTLFRFFTALWMGLVTVCYLLYRFFPLSLPLPVDFSWGHKVSIAIAVLITIPAATIHIKGIADAGKETMIPEKGQTLYKGIYKYIRHPQAVGEAALCWTIAFLLNSPFLVLYSIVWIPIFYFMCVAEERDLIIRYGEPYTAYRKQTGMFFPKLRRRAGD